MSEYAYIVWTLTINGINTQETQTTGLKHQSFKYELVNSSTGVSYGSGNFEGKDVGDTITFSNNTENLAYNTDYTFTLYLWIDGTIGRNPNDMTNQTYEFSLVCDITGEGTNKVQDMPVTSGQYITNLYTNAPKQKAKVNNIDYNLAPSVGLMNDRLGGTTNSLDGGDIRYYGSNPQNYVWLEDTYASAYTFTFGDRQVTRPANKEKLWRIIGVFDGRLKLISNDPISSIGLSWDTSPNSTGGNSGYGINEWSQSDLMKLLNPGYENESVNNSLYWNNGEGTVYTGRSNVTKSEVSFENTGISDREKELIDFATWYLGAYNGTSTGPSYVSEQYAAERQGTTLGKICSSGGSCNDDITRTATWNGKVGLMYASDFGYSTDLLQCTATISASTTTPCIANNWLLGSSQWTISSRANARLAAHVFFARNTGGAGSAYAFTAYSVRPVIYLKPEVVITDGRGTELEPYEVELSSSN